MRTLNDPLGDEDQRRKEQDWTPAVGYRRALVRGAVAMVILAGLSLIVALTLPGLLLLWYSRLPIAFFFTFVMLAVVQRAAGMVGWGCTLLGVMLTAAVLLSHHVFFAMFGVVIEEGPRSGAYWLRLPMLLTLNAIPAIGVVFAAALGHRGAEFEAILELFGVRLQGTTR